jgi:formylglycine-generating enzyme required for sulfatase activity
MRVLAAIVVLSALLSAQDRRVAPASGGRRMALVIGNDAYPWKRLTNAVNDARALAAMLPRVGFDTRDITLVTDANLRQMQRAGREFIEKLRPDDLAFVYYSGHGVEVRGENFLIPVDFPADATELEARDEAYSAQQLLRGLEETQARTRILILDACRNNPLRATRAAGGGLARMDGKGTLVVFATSAGSTADDNPRGSNGLFASQLLKALPTPGVTVGQMMQDVARAVYRDSGARQTPAIYGLLLEDFPLVAGVNPGPKPDAAAETWALIRDSRNAEDFEAFANAYPASDLAPGARIRAAQLRRSAPAAEPPVRAGQRTKVNPKDGLTYVWIEPGEFMMGCVPGDDLCFASEKPQRAVKIARGFWMGQTPVTQAAYQRVTGNNPSQFKGPRLPVETVTWKESENYCVASGMRLPTEEEWEYAARAGTTGVRYGDVERIGWFHDNSDGHTHEVMQKEPNAWGLYDMLGNVYEWAGGWFTTGQSRPMRGGCWTDAARALRSWERNGGPTDYHNSFVGFRCAGD